MHAYAVHIIHDVIVKLLDSQQSLRDAEGRAWSAAIFFYIHTSKSASCGSLMAHSFSEYSDEYAPCNQMASVLS